MSFTARSIANLKDSIDIVDVISRRISLKRAGSNYKGVCPFHNEKTPSFVVSEAKQIFTCFGCGASGDAIEFVKRYNNLEFNDAIRQLASEYGIEMEENRGYGEDLEIYYNINRDAALFFYKAFTEKANKGYSYMKRRGIRPEILKKFGIGYADESWNSLYEHLTQKGYPVDKLIEVGLVSESKGRYYDKFRNRVIFPIINTAGKVIGFGGRAIDPSDNPKYLNSPESKVFRKKNNLYGLNLSRASVGKEGFIILVEGYMDTISLYQGGITNVVASLGTALTENQSHLIKRYTKDVVLSYDSDSAGVAAALRGMEILHNDGLKVRIIKISGGKDPDELIRNEGRDAFRKLVENALSFGDYKLNYIKSKYNLNDDDSRIECIKEIADSLSKLGAVEQDIYIKKVSKELSVSEAALRMEINNSTSNAEQLQRRSENTAEPLEVLSSIEKNCLRLITRNESYIQRVDDNIEMLTTTLALNIFSAIKQQFAENGQLDVNSLIDSLDDNETKALVDVIETIPIDGEEEMIFEDCKRRYKQEKLRSEQEQVIAMLSMLDEEENSQKRQHELMLRLKQIQDEISEI